MRNFIVLLAFCFLSHISFAAEAPFAEISADPDPPQAAWWFRVTYNPTGKTIYGIPLAKIDKTWCEANLFSLDKFPPEIAAEIGRVFSEKETIPYTNSPSNYSFTTPRFTAGPYHNLQASVGVYRHCQTNKTGVFLLVTDWKNRSRPRLIYKESFPDNTFTMARIFPGEDLVINWCYGCDDGSTYWWVNGKFQRKIEDDGYEQAP